MATQTYRNIYQDSTTTERPQTNTTYVGERNDTASSATNDKADNALNRAYNTGAQIRPVEDLGFSQEQLDRNKLLALYNQAAKTQYDVGNTEYEQAFNEYGRGLNSAQDSYIAAMRQANANAIASGAARGTQAANELSTMLGLQQQSVSGATDLANQRAQLGLDYAKALSEARVNAESEAFDRNRTVAELLSQYFASDNDRYGMLGYGALADYLGGNTKQTTKTGDQTTKETTGKKITTTKYK